MDDTRYDLKLLKSWTVHTSGMHMPSTMGIGNASGTVARIYRKLVRLRQSS